MLNVLSGPAATVVATAAFTGLRLGELRGLTWESYDPAHDEGSLGWLNVTRSVWRNTVGDPKTAKSKAPVPVIPQLAQRLDAHRLKCGNPVAGPIFPNSVGRPLVFYDLDAPALAVFLVVECPLWPTLLYYYASKIAIFGIHGGSQPEMEFCFSYTSSSHDSHEESCRREKLSATSHLSRSCLSRPLDGCGLDLLKRRLVESHTTVIIPLDDRVLHVRSLDTAEYSSRLPEVVQTLDAISGIQFLIAGRGLAERWLLGTV